MLEEAGIGKGVTREFLCELLKESFDPNKGLFRSSDQKELFPNPQVTHWLVITITWCCYRLI